MKSRTAQHEPPKPSPGMASDVLSVHWRMWLLECTSAHSELEVLGTEQRLLDPRLPQSLNGGIFLRVWWDPTINMRYIPSGRDFGRSGHGI